MGASQSAKIPKDLQNAKVQVALQKTCYQSGDRVGGYVDINITGGSVKCTKIDVEMKAESLTTVHYTTSSGSGKNRRTVMSGGYSIQYNPIRNMTSPVCCN